MKASRHFFLFLGCFWLTGAGVAGAADDPLAQAKVLFMQRQYVQTIDACTSVIGAHPGERALAAEANYWTAASYLNLFDFLTAKKNFKAIVERYKGTPYYEDAFLGWGDVEFLQENYPEALVVYTMFLKENPSKKRLATAYFRLAETHLRLGDKATSQQYLDKLSAEFPGSFELRDARRLKENDIFYTVQVGAFTNYDNAEKFIARLKAKGYEVYSVVCLLSGKKLCRIRVGKFRTEGEAQALARKLAADGYYGKIFPRDDASR